MSAQSQAIVVSVGAAVTVVVLCILWSMYVRSRRRDDLDVKRGRFNDLAATLDIVDGHVRPGDGNQWPPPTVLATPHFDPVRGIDLRPPSSQARTSLTGDQSRWEGPAFGALGAVDVLQRWSATDAHVFDAVSQLTNSDVNGLTDLRRVLYGHAASGEQYQIHSRQFLDMLKGHVGEQFVAEDFAQTGADVEIHEQSNHPGSDMTINGQEVDVKTVEDASSAASAHFAEHSDIPIVIPGDASNIPDGAVYFDPSQPIDLSVLQGDHLVLVDQALSLRDVGDATANSLTAVDASGAVDNPGFPIITALMVAGRSVYRERGLLKKGSTTIGRAGKNVAKDVSTITGGVWLTAAGGLKIGVAIDAAAAGTLMGVPTLVCTVGGVLIGRRAARSLAKRWREGPLRSAQLELERSLLAVESEIARVDNQLRSEWSAESERVARQLANQMLEVRQEFEAVMRDLQSQMQQEIACSESQLLAMLDHVATILPASPTPRLKRAGGLGAVVRRRADNAALRRAVRRWKRLRRIEWTKVNSIKRVAFAFDLAMLVPWGQEQAGTYLDHVSDQRTAAREACTAAARTAEANAVAARQEADRQLAVLAQRCRLESVDAEAAMAPLFDDLELSRMAFSREFRAAGYDIEDPDLEAAGAAK